MHREQSAAAVTAHNDGGCWAAPQALTSRVRPGQVLPLQCDGCASGLQARVSFVASGPEFTPPVIYSVESRQKLVVLVRAELLGAAASLSPGQIVDVPLAALGGT